MKPFLLLQSRPEDEASDNEYDGFLSKSGLLASKLLRVRLEQTGVPKINFEDYSAIILGGGPSNVSDPLEKKSEAQRTFEPQLFSLIDQIIEQDYPFLGACYGIGVVGTHLGGVISNKYAESVGAAKIRLTKEGIKDPITADMLADFEAFLGHKEACEVLPKGATLLASSSFCPVQMFRIKSNVYVTQFHPELDSEGLEVRIKIYKHEGYFPPEDAEKLIALGHSVSVHQPEKILQNFVKRYKKS